MEGESPLHPPDPDRPVYVVYDYARDLMYWDGSGYVEDEADAMVFDGREGAEGAIRELGGARTMNVMVIYSGGGSRGD